MGDFAKKKQAENFKKARDKAVEAAKQQFLVDRPTTTAVTFTITPAPGQQLVPNEALILLPQGDAVAVLRGHERVGQLNGEAANVAQQAMGAAGSPDAVKVKVIGVAELSGVAQAQMTN
jgi:hypothetical protein